MVRVGSEMAAPVLTVPMSSASTLLKISAPCVNYDSIPQKQSPSVCRRDFVVCWLVVGYKLVHMLLTCLIADSNIIAGVVIASCCRFI